MRYSLLLLGVGLLAVGACDNRSATYRALDESGMWSSSLQQLRKLKASDQEVAQLVKLKQVGASDDLCLSLLKIARERHREFTSGDAVINLSRAGYGDPQILELARSDQIDILSGEAVTLKLIGLSNETVQTVLRRRMQGLPTLTSPQIGRLKNTGMSEKQILELVEQGLSGQQAEAFVAQREASRNHSNTDFVRVRGHRPR